MADQEQLPTSLQEAVLALLCFEGKYGALAAAQVTSDHFDGIYRDAAIAVLSYRQRYGKSPGRTHLEHLLSRLPGASSGRRAEDLKRLAASLLGYGELNGEYVAGRVQEHVRSQLLKTALNDATDRYLQGQQDGTNMVDDVEQILYKVLSHRQETMDAGTFLSDPSRAIQFLTEREKATIMLGIKPLDRLGIGLAPKQMLLYIAPKNTGKSWFSVHCGRQALIQHQRVVHITLEMSEEEVILRYLQNFFGIATDPDKYIKTVLEFDELQRLKDFYTENLKPRLEFGAPDIQAVLRKKMKSWGTRFGRLVVKWYPSGSLTMSKLQAYLDYLEMVHKFIPGTLIVDYPDLMAVDGRDFRHSTGQNFVNLRGVGGERNLCVVAPTQGNRSSLSSKKTRSDQVSEDISKVFTADNVLSFSRTEAEERLNLARLHVEHARHARRGDTILMSQSYATGQYVMQSTMMQKRYWELMKEQTGAEPEND